MEYSKNDILHDRGFVESVDQVATCSDFDHRGYCRSMHRDRRMYRGWDEDLEPP